MTNKPKLMQKQTILQQASEAGAIDAASQALRQGELVVFPTDTVYGVGCDAFNAAAIQQLYAVKQRPFEKGIPILLADSSDLARVAQNVGPMADSLIAHYWPGPLTLIVPRHPDLPAEIAPGETIAVRIPACVVARAVIRGAGGALATSSANLSGEAPAKTGAEAFAALAGRVAIVVEDGPSSQSAALPSTIIDCTVEPPVILREGPISADDLTRMGYNET